MFCVGKFYAESYNPISVSEKPSKVYKMKIFMLIFLLKFSISHVSILISKEESKRLFNISRDIYFVRNGKMNLYAMKVEHEVFPSNIDHVDFHWKSDIPDTPYRMKATTTLEKPNLNISNIGFIPTEFETFRVLLKYPELFNDIGHINLEVKRLRTVQSFKETL